ncbi:MAG: winged helix-turn-helix transcriptional regulator [Oscillospiraceae bacterium]|nr:winged helix-turn-helix transcriptional regulator [Oscillospiraceae bacterium]
MSNVVTVGESLKNSDCTFEQRQHDIVQAEKYEAEERERARRSPFKKFAQINLDPEQGKIRRKLMMDCPSAYAIFDFLMENVDGYNAIICSAKVLEEALNLSHPTVINALKELRRRQFITVKKSGRANVYLINKRLIWKSWGTNYRFAKFAASIILSESEQEEMEKPTKMTRMNVLELKECNTHDQESANSDKLEYDEDFDDFEAGADREE